MKLAEINALRGMDRDELVDEAERVGVVDDTTRHWTVDSIRLAIIDAVCDRELADAAEGEGRR